MGFWVYMLVMALLLPVTMTAFGARFSRRPPSRINSVFGYRTARSMQSTEAWDYAHRYIGRLWLRIGLAALPVSVLIMLLVLAQPKETVGRIGSVLMVFQLAVLFLPVFFTERTLRQRFGRNSQQ